MLKQLTAASLRPLARAVTARTPRILMYHRFTTRGEWRKTDVAQFEAQLAYIRKYFKPVRLRDLVRAQTHGEPISRRAVVVTIDDGYADFGHHAADLLEKYEIPSTLYVISDFAAQKIWLWYDALQYLMLNARAGHYTVAADDGGFEFELGGVESRRRAWGAAADVLLPLSPNEKLAFERALQDALDTELPAQPTEEYRGMTWDELGALDAELVEIGSHSRTHPILSTCTSERQEDEILGSRRIIEAELNVEVESFCYPNGQAGDYDDDTLALLERGGYSSSVLAYGGFVSTADQRFELPRFSDGETMPIFRNAICGLGHLKMRLRDSS